MRFSFLQRSLKVILEGDMGKRWKWHSLLLCGNREAHLTIDPHPCNREHTELNTVASDNWWNWVTQMQIKNGNWWIGHSLDWEVTHQNKLRCRYHQQPTCLDIWLLETFESPSASVSPFQSRVIIVAMLLYIRVQKCLVKYSAFPVYPIAPWAPWFWNTQRGLGVFWEKDDLLNVRLHIPFLSQFTV